MITTKPRDPLFINAYGHAFTTHEQAEYDQSRLDAQAPKHQLRVIGTPPGESPFGIDRVFDSSKTVLCLDDSKAPYTGQAEGTSRVYLFKDLIAAMQRFVDQHGDGVGYTDHHCGMGRNSREIVVIEPLVLPLAPKPESPFFGSAQVVDHP